MCIRTLLPDGRLDLCKMVVGNTGIKPLLDAMQNNDSVKRYCGCCYCCYYCCCCRLVFVVTVIVVFVIVIIICCYWLLLLLLLLLLLIMTEYVVVGVGVVTVLLVQCYLSHSLGCYLEIM